MKCGNCGFESPSGFTFCGKCGTLLVFACRQCGFENPPDFGFCGTCGTSLKAPVQDERLTIADLDHLRTYLPPSLIEALQFDLVSPPPRLLEECTTHLSELLKTIHTLLPPYLIEQVVRDPTPGRTWGKFVDGTLLFADISGFTAMSERLSRIGREGAEEITAIVNRYFSTMLSILKDHDGQLVKFGGDALLGLFLEPDSATRAVQAAHCMQAAMSEFAQTRTSQGVYALQMKVGIHKGQFFAAQLGTPQGMEYALFGADVNATAATESAAVAGQILLDRATGQAVTSCQVIPAPQSDHYLIVKEITSFTTSPTVHTPTLLRSPESTLDGLQQAVKHLDALTPYLPAGLLSRIFSDPHAVSLEGEHRLVAVLFANVRGLGEIVDQLGPGREEQIVTALNRYFTAMDSSIRRFGGVINKIDLYDHGDKLLALFGAPVAHEDDVERAVRAALAMQETMSEIACSLPTHTGVPDLCLSQQIGINFGFVFAGYVGTGWRHEYTVMGDEVNLAARLMTTAEPGRTLVSSDVRRKVQALFDLTSRDPVQLKGKSMPIPTFSVVGPRAIPEPVRGLKGMSSPLVGRQTEWEQLRAAIEQLMLGRGQIVSVTGEAGLGKSRLVAEMRQGIADGPICWIEGRCLSFTESVSYRPFQEIVQKLLNIQPDDSEAEAWGKLHAEIEQKLVPEEVADTLPYLANFLNLRIDEALQEKVRYLDAEALQRHTFVAINTLIQSQSSAESPLVLVLEDIHWLDQASLALLEHLIPLVNRAPLALIMLYRHERAKGCWQVHERIIREFSHCATSIALHHLTPVDGQQLLANLVGIENWPIKVRELILDRTEGNPLYLEEVIRTLVDDQTLVQDNDGEWRIGSDIDVESITVPDTLQGVLMARLDRLKEPPRWTAQLASVVGRVFHFDVLAHIVPESGSLLGQCLVQLQQHETVRETQRVPELVYTFKHAMMQEVCYGSLLARTRRLYHHKVAKHLETGRSAGRRDAESNIPLIAHHAFVGQDWPRALHYQLLAGQQAQKLFANHEAIDHLEKALQSITHLPTDETLAQRQVIHTTLGELLTTTSQYEHALKHLNKALAMSIESDNQNAQAHVCRWLARLHEFRSEYPPALEWIQQGLTALAGQETAEAAELLLWAGQIHLRQGNNDNALIQCQEGLRIAKQLDEVTVLARAHNLLGRITRLRGNNAMAIEHFRQAFGLYERAGDIYGQAISHNLIANAHFDIGQWQAADEHYRQARKYFDQMGDVYFCAIVDNNLGGIASNQGRLDDALAFYQAALSALKRIGESSYVLGILHMNLGATFIRRDQADAARQHLYTSQDYFEQAQARDFLSEMYRHFAKTALLADELAEAEAYGQQALSLARELEMRGEEGCALRVLGEVATAQKQFETAEEYLSEGLLILQQVGDIYKGARTQLSLARAHAAHAKPEAGLAALDLCTQIFQQLGATLDLAAAQALGKDIARILEARS
ncbi:MAG: AAA family ATPase [Chloroflexi bacterium]|nr:AAA family ATPase [Chloroflexota bacterium]